MTHTDDMLAAILRNIERGIRDGIQKAMERDFNRLFPEHPEMKWEPWQSVWAGKDDDGSE